VLGCATQKNRARLTVDTAHLLGKHDSRGSVVGTPDSRDAEAVPESGEVAGATGDLEFLLVDDVRVVVVPRSNNVVGTKTRHGPEALGNLAVLHEPSGRLGAEKDAASEDEGRNEGRSKLQAPGDAGNVLYDDVGAEAQEDTDHDPQLPKHDQSTADTMGGHLGGEDGHCSVLSTDADAHDEAGGEQLLPRLCETGPDGGGGEDNGSEEDLAATAQVLVERVDDECANETGRQENDGVDDTDDPLVGGAVLDVEFLGEGQVGAVGSSLIPALGGGTDGTQRD